MEVKSLIKKVIFDCVRCKRFRATINMPQMGQFIKERIVLALVFSSTGIDAAGPLTLKASMLRTSKIINCWIIIFICIVIKAIHLEICTELSSDNFQLL